MVNCVHDPSPLILILRQEITWLWFPWQRTVQCHVDRGFSQCFNRELGDVDSLYRKFLLHDVCWFFLFVISVHLSFTQNCNLLNSLILRLTQHDSLYIKVLCLVLTCLLAKVNTFYHPSEKAFKMNNSALSNNRFSQLRCRLLIPATTFSYGVISEHIIWFFCISLLYQ